MGTCRFESSLLLTSVGLAGIKRAAMATHHVKVSSHFVIVTAPVTVTDRVMLIVRAMPITRAMVIDRETAMRVPAIVGNRDTRNDSPASMQTRRMT
jgi:hypothetical protein